MCDFSKEIPTIWVHQKNVLKAYKMQETCELERGVQKCVFSKEKQTVWVHPKSVKTKHSE